ncbi:MAG: two-component regulator propeller domain-containing protein [Terracidiphilus sp.]
MSRIVLLCIASYSAAFEHPSDEVTGRASGSTPPTYLATNPSFRAGRTAHGSDAQVGDLRFSHLTTNDGLSQSNVKAILQDRRGFMWFATQDGLDRYDGNTFVVYKHNPKDPNSISANLVTDLIEDDQGDLWIATYTGGVSRFDPRTDRFTRYLHDAKNVNSISADSVNSIARDKRGCLWFGTEANGLDKFDPTGRTFTHYLNDSHGQFVGRITHVTEDNQGEIWFVGERGLFHLNPRTGEMIQPPATRNGLGADYVFGDKAGNLWMLAYAPIVGLVKYDPLQERVTTYPVGAGGVGLVSSKLFADETGIWVPSSLGLYYFDRQTERLTRLFHHDESNPESLNDDAVISVYQDRSGVLWVGTENGGLNTLNFQQEQFARFAHRPNDPASLSPGRVTAIYRDSEDALWVGFSPRALDRLDRKTGHFTHFVAVKSLEEGSGSEKGTDVNGLYKDSRGYLWLGGWGAGLDRLDERTGQVKHYRRKPDDPNSLPSNHVIRIFGDRSGRLWVGHIDGVARLDPANGRFTFYRPDPKNPTKYGNAASGFYQDRSGTIWVSRGEGVLSRYDDKSDKFVDYLPDSHDPHKLNGGDVNTIHEDRMGALWMGASDGLYRYNRQDDTFIRYTENQGLPSSTIQGILEDKAGRLWISTKNGLSRLDPQAETFRNYDVSDGLLSNDFSRSSYAQGPNGEMFFGGSKGLSAFYPEAIRDNPYVPPVVITSFKVFNKPVPIGPESLLKKAIPYVDSLTLSYRESVFSFEFAALSYANAQKNQYRYKLEGFEPGWNEVGSKQRLATYTNLEPGTYVFRVQGSNNDGVWNEQGVSLNIVIAPPWWRTNWFRALCTVLILALAWTVYLLRVRHLHREFAVTLDARVAERTNIARDLHDTLLQSAQGLLLQLEVLSQMQEAGPIKAKAKLAEIMDRTAKAITEGRDAVQGLRASSVQTNDLAQAIETIGEELAADPGNHGSPAFKVTVEGAPRNLHPILRDEIYRIAAEALRNAFHHASATHIEVEIRYGPPQFRMRVRDDGKGIDPSVLSSLGAEGHYGLRGMRERAAAIGGTLEVWSEAGAGTEMELCVPAAKAYGTPPRKASRWAQRFVGRW